MAQRSCVIKGTQGFSYQGLFRSPQSNFTLNGLDVYEKAIDGNGTAYGASVEFQTGFKKVHAAKVINVSSETGNAASGLTFTFGAKGAVTVAGLDSLNSSDVIIFVAIGTRV